MPNAKPTPYFSAASTPVSGMTMSLSANRVIKLFCLTNQAFTISHSESGSSKRICSHCQRGFFPERVSE
jgi:hypothetical protein